MKILLNEDAIIGDNELVIMFEMQYVTSEFLLNPIRSLPKFVELIRLDQPQMNAK